MPNLPSSSLRRVPRRPYQIVRLVATPTQPLFVCVEGDWITSGGRLTHTLLPGDELWVVSQRKRRLLLSGGVSR